MRVSTRRWLQVIGLGLVLALALPSILIPPLENHLIITLRLERADAVVIMAGSPDERLPPAVQLYREGRAPKILLTNDGVLGAWSEERGRNLYHIEWSEQALLDQNIPAGAIEKLDFSVSGTIHDASHAMDFARRKGLRSLLVVTSDYHTQRTLWSFRRVFRDHPIEIGMHPAPVRGYPNYGYDRLYQLTSEVLKFVYYLLMY